MSLDIVIFLTDLNMSHISFISKFKNNIELYIEQNILLLDIIKNVIGHRS